MSKISDAIPPPMGCKKTILIDANIHIGGRMTRLKPERFQFTSAEGFAIACVKWSGDHPVRGVVQIAHGLGEHMGRYAELADTLIDGEFVYGNDHRGHGLTANLLEVLATLDRRF